MNGSHILNLFSHFSDNLNKIIILSANHNSKLKENLDDNHLHKNPNDKISSLEKLTKDNFSKDSTFPARLYFIS